MIITRKQLRKLISESALHGKLSTLFCHDDEEYIKLGVFEYNTLNNTDIEFLNKESSLHHMFWESPKDEWPDALSFYSSDNKSLKDLSQFIFQSGYDPALDNDYYTIEIYPYTPEHLWDTKVETGKDTGYLLRMWNFDNCGRQQ